MAIPIPYAYREKILQMSKSGKSPQQIAESFSYSVRSIQRLCRCCQQQGKQGLLTKYHQAGRPKTFQKETWAKVAEVRDGQQGAPYVRSVLQEKYPGMNIPHECTIQRHWKAAGTSLPRGRPKQKSTWTKQPNHTWQIDGKGHLPIATEEQLSWMNVADEATGSDLHAELFPPSDSRSLR